MEYGLESNYILVYADQNHSIYQKSMQNFGTFTHLNWPDYELTVSEKNMREYYLLRKFCGTIACKKNIQL